MQPKELINRGNNLLAVAIVALSAIAFIPDFFVESEWSGKFDELIIILFGIAGVAWYLRGNNRFLKSLIPVWLVTTSFLVKVIGLILEFKDAEDVGDDIGTLILFFAATIFIVYLYRKDPKLP